MLNWAWVRHGAGGKSWCWVFYRCTIITAVGVLDFFLLLFLFGSSSMLSPCLSWIYRVDIIMTLRLATSLKNTLDVTKILNTNTTYFFVIMFNLLFFPLPLLCFRRIEAACRGVLWRIELELGLCCYPPVAASACREPERQGSHQRTWSADTHTYTPTSQALNGLSCADRQREEVGSNNTSYDTRVLPHFPPNFLCVISLQSSVRRHHWSLQSPSSKIAAVLGRRGF